MDAGHSEAGVKTLCKTLDALFADQPIIAIMAMMKDKDYDACIPAIAKRSKLLIGASVGLPRSLTPQQVAENASAFCPAISAGTVADAISLARTQADEHDLILICGSVYAAGDALLALEQ